VGLREIAARLAYDALPVPPVDQSPAMCGPASLRAVLLYWGSDVSEDELATLSGATVQDGTSPTGLAHAAWCVGFHAWVWENVSLERLSEWLRAGDPVIVDWLSGGDGHYSVATRVDSERIWLMDPETGDFKAIDLATFLPSWRDLMYEGTPYEREVLRLAIRVVPMGKVKA
jgi:predicted double-glycine peptidase